MKPKLISTPKKNTQISKAKKVRMVITSELLSRFLRLLEQGFIVTTKTGCSIKDLLCEQLGINEDYLDNRIQTLFLDGKPVDNVEKAYIQKGVTLALSGAMPGLVGATLRKGGTLASMRNTISYDGDPSQNSHEEAQVKLKLFNMVLKDLGPSFLENGIRVGNDRFKQFLSQNREDIKAACSSIHLNDQKINIIKLEGMAWKGSGVFLQVKTGKS